MIFIIEVVEDHHNFYKFRCLDPLRKLMKISENKKIKSNGLRALAHFCDKLHPRIKNSLSRRKTLKFIAKEIAQENDIDHLTNALTCLRSFLFLFDFDVNIIKTTGCLSKMVTLLRYQLISNIYKNFN